MPKNKIPVYLKGRGITANISVAHNQKVIEITKVNPKKGKILDIASNKQALQELSLAAYVLYMHFILNVPGYKEALSVKTLTETTALSTKTYYKAVEELIEKGYLVKTPSPQFSEYYLFYENPSLCPNSQSPTAQADLFEVSSEDEI